MTSNRTYPKLPGAGRSPNRPISFVVVRFSGEYEHNFLRSECVSSQFNEVIEVDNRGNLFFDNLSEAMLHGVSRARHDLIAFVHEDVRLVDGWQSRFEESLSALERWDDQWAVLGSVGWVKGGGVAGHWSDPFRYENTFASSRSPFCEVDRLDEQLLICHRARLPVFDINLPGIHHIGRDLAIGMRCTGLKTYALDAPTIHKYRDRQGQLVLSHESSEKIKDRQSLTYLADKACCDNYIAHKWPELQSIYPCSDEFQIPFSDAGKCSQLDRPLILLSRGGSGSRLLSAMAEDAGIFLGNELNGSGDAVEMVVPIYRAITETYRCRANWQRQQAVPRIRAAAARMINDLPEESAWGFKLPESILTLPELLMAFPEARFIHQIRDPATTCLRRTHMTARLDNHIGRVALPAAYDHVRRERINILSDSPAEHMAYTTIHQLELVAKLKASLDPSRFFEIRFEDVITRPGTALRRLCSWLGTVPGTQRIEELIDTDRATSPTVSYPGPVVANVKRILAAIRQRNGYGDE